MALLRTFRDDIIFVFFVLIVLNLVSCKNTPKPIRVVSLEEGYNSVRKAEKESGIYCGACTNETHEYGVDICTEYIGPKTIYGTCETCGCSRYDHWGKIGLNSDLSFNDDQNDLESENYVTATFLRVSNDNLNFNYTGGEKTVNVYTDGEWVIDVGSAHWVETIVTEKQITFIVSDNDDEEKRTDYIILKAGEKEVKIDIEQKGRPSACIERIWLEHNETFQGMNGMIIRVNFTVYNLKGKSVNVCAYFFDDNDAPLQGYSNMFKTTDGQSCTGRWYTMKYDEGELHDFFLFMPYLELNQVLGSSSGTFKVAVGISTFEGKGLAQSDFEFFSWG